MRLMTRHRISASIDGWPLAVQTGSGVSESYYLYVRAWLGIAMPTNG